MTALSITTFTSERFVTRLVRACFYESPRRQRAQQRIEENRRGVKSANDMNANDIRGDLGNNEQSVDPVSIKPISTDGWK